MVTVKAYAKINLTLNILSKRNDGYHDVEMIMQSVSLYDTVTVEIRDKAGITLSCDMPDVPNDESNIAYKTARLYLEKVGRADMGLHIHIEKRIPVKAGLAGGSADGAAVLVGLNSIFDNALSTDELCGLGAKVGADVPFCIKGATMLASGTGTQLKLIDSMPRCSIVIAKPDISVSTPKAYSLFDERGKTNPCGNVKAIDALSNGNFDGLCCNMFNVFEQVICDKGIDDIKHIMEQSGAVKAQMSGSGPSVFGIFSDKTAADNTKAALYKAGFIAHYCEPVNVGCEITAIG